MKVISRKAFLVGSGATLALPFFASLEKLAVAAPGAPGKAGKAGKARRFCSVFFPFGVSVPPKSDDPGTRITRTTTGFPMVRVAANTAQPFARASGGVQTGRHDPIGSVPSALSRDRDRSSQRRAVPQWRQYCARQRELGQPRPVDRVASRGHDKVPVADPLIGGRCGCAVGS